MLRTPVQNGDAGWSSPFGLKLIHWINSLTASPHQATPDFAPGPQTPGSNGDAGWSSPVARQAHNLKVVGSNPTPATNFKLLSNQHSTPRTSGSAGGTHASLAEVAPRPADHKLKVVGSDVRSAGQHLPFLPCELILAGTDIKLPRRNSSGVGGEGRICICHPSTVRTSPSAGWR